MSDGQAHAAERVPRAAARAARSSSSRCSTRCAHLRAARLRQLETRAVEPLDQLLRKGDTSKEVYVLRPAPGRRRRAGDAGLGLHFDLTVPFARYVLENAGKLEFPFRRYQIQKAWRGERPQEGRYREFTQADIDIVGRDALPFHHDVEVARVMVDALTRARLPARRPPPGQQPQADPGLLPRARASRTSTRSCGSSTSSTSCPRTRSRGCWSTEAGPRPEQADACLALATIARRHLLRRRGPRARGRATRCSTRASRAGRRRRGLRVAGRPTGSRSWPTSRSPAAWTTTPARSSRPGWRATSGSARSARAAATTPSPATAARTYPGVGISLGVSRLLVPLLASAACSTGSRPCPAPSWWRWPTRTSAQRATRVATALRARGVAVRGRRAARRSSASRSATPSGAASRSSGSPAARPGRGRPGQGHPHRRPGRRRPRHLGPPAEDLAPRVIHREGATR